MKTMWNAMRRGLSPKFPEEMVTGQPALDDYLRQLDAQLWGSAKVRLVELSEIRDHLVESHAALVRQGQSPSHAAEVAVSQAGSFEDIVHNQHQTLLKRFRDIIWITPFLGLNHTVMVYVIERNKANILELDVNPHWIWNAAVGVILAFIMISYIAWHFSFQMPSTILGSRPPKGPSFLLQKSTHIHRGFLTVLYALHLAVVGNMAIHHTAPWWFLILLAVGPVLIVLYALKGVSFGVNESGPWSRTWPIRTRQIKWEEVERFGPVDTTVIPFLKTKSDYRSYYLDYWGAPDFRKLRRWMLSPAHLTNVDKFFLLLEEKTGLQPVPLSRAKLHQPSRPERLNQGGI